MKNIKVSLKTVANGQIKKVPTFGKRIVPKPSIQDRPAVQAKVQPVIKSPHNGLSITPLYDFIPTELIAHHQKEG